MSRRLGILGTVMAVLFLILAGQAAFISFFRAGALDSSPQNPRNATAAQLSPRGDILAANGQPLAHSIASGDSTYPWKRVYPFGSLTAGMVGFSSDYYGVWALEAQYDTVLTAHPQVPQSWAQVLSPVSLPDTIVTTIQPSLQKVAQTALAGRDGAVVALDPRTGAILAMYSNPTYNPNLITSVDQSIEQKAFKGYNTNDANSFPPLGLVATQQSFPPGSTFKIVTTAAAVHYNSTLLTKSYPVNTCITLPTTVNHQLCNSGLTPCGGTVAVMLPASCDPGYALLGLDVGGVALAKQANAFGYNHDIPLDLPGVARSNFPPGSIFSNDLPQLAFSSIGQENVRATALQNALVAAGIANQGVIMTPHIMSSILSPQGALLQMFKPSPWLIPLRPEEARQIVPLMQAVVTGGTASGVGFLPQDDVAAKTGTAQVGNSQHNTDDWMIAFAPASHPTVAIAVVVPFQLVSAFGATVAGPIVKCMVEATLALQNHLPTANTPTTCAG